MTPLLCHIIKIHSEKDITNTPEWSRYSLKEPLWEITITIKYCGIESTVTEIFRESAWKKAKEDGYFYV